MFDAGILDEFCAGFHAYEDGVDIDLNPYEIGTQEWCDWRDGWYTSKGCEEGGKEWGDD